VFRLGGDLNLGAGKRQIQVIQSDGGGAHLKETRRCFAFWKKGGFSSLGAGNRFARGKGGPAPGQAQSEEGPAMYAEVIAVLWRTVSEKNRGRKRSGGWQPRALHQGKRFVGGEAAAKNQWNSLAAGLGGAQEGTAPHGGVV